jgi:hypothetical protein
MRIMVADKQSEWTIHSYPLFMFGSLLLLWDLGGKEIDQGRLSAVEKISIQKARKSPNSLRAGQLFSIEMLEMCRPLQKIAGSLG